MDENAKRLVNTQVGLLLRASSKLAASMKQYGDGEQQRIADEIAELIAQSQYQFMYEVSPRKTYPNAKREEYYRRGLTARGKLKLYPRG